jgi:hypothetical protein
MSHDEDSSLDDFYAQPVEKPTPAETRAAAELVVYLEDEFGADVRRLYVRVREGHVYIQGNVATHEIRRRIEESVPKRTGVLGFDHNIAVQENE